MATLKKYENGLSLIVSTEQAYSTTFAIMIKAGCINETAKNNGISHYIEHMNFKGTEKLSYYDISNQLEFLGTSYNAYTGFEVTCFHAKSIPENNEKSFEIMTDMVLNSIYDDEEAEKEKGVIIEEINMSEDTPDDVCHELVSKAFYGDNGYGRTILGSVENVKSFTKNDVKQYLNDNYVASNMVVSMTGKITQEEAERLVEKYLLPYVKTGKPANVPTHNIVNKRQSLYKVKDIEQSHIFLAFPTFTFIDKDKILGNVVSNILGGGMSSRLFTKVREELGLAYSVYCYDERFVDSGTFKIYAGVGNDKVDLAYNAIKETILETQKNITDVEFKKALNGLKAGAIFSQERASSSAQAYAKYYLLTGEIYDVQQKIDEIDLVKKDDVIDVIRSINFDDMASAVVGKYAKPLK